MATKSELRFSKLLERIERLIALGLVKVGRRVPPAEIAAVEAAEGRPLSPFYVALLTKHGCLGKQRRHEHDGTYYISDHCRVYGPKLALAITSDLRKEHGAGRYAKILARTFFFLHWRRVNQYYGVDDEGNVRVLHVARPGTVLKVESRDIATTMSKLVSDVEEDVPDDAKKGVGAGSVASLSIERSSELTAKRIAELASLEQLTIEDEPTKEVLARLAKLDELSELVLWHGGVALPDALFEAPKLETLELRGASKRFGPGLNPLLRWMKESAVPPKKRHLYVRLLAGEEVSAEDDDLLDVLDAKNERVVMNAISALAQRIPAPKSVARAKVVFLGHPKTKAGALSKQLEEAGASVVKDVASATLAVVCAGHGGLWRGAKKKKIALVVEPQLSRLLDARGARFLPAQAVKEPALVERLRELLTSPDHANVDLACAMMKEGGVPLGPSESNGVLEAMVLVMQDKERPAKLRSAIEKLAISAAGDVVAQVKKVWAGSSIFLSNPLKSTDRLHELAKATKGRFSSKRFALDFAEHGEKDGYGVIGLFALECGDEVFAREVLDRGMRAGSLGFDLGAGAGERVVRAIEKSKAFAELAPGMTTFALGQGVKELPSVVVKMRALRELHLQQNELSTLPPELASLTKLEVLHVGENRFATFPEVVCKLPELRELVIYRNEKKPGFTTVPESIGALTKLETLGLWEQKIEALPSAIGKLTKLKELQLSGTRLGTLPEELLMLSALECVTLPSRATNAKEIAATLRKRGVDVS